MNSARLARSRGAYGVAMAATGALGMNEPAFGRIDDGADACTGIDPGGGGRDGFGSVEPIGAGPLLRDAPATGMDPGGGGRDGFGKVEPIGAG
jgi:hypothetical protein